LRSAAILLAQWAADVRSSCVNQATRTLDDPGAQATYDKHMKVVKRLRQIANAEQKRLTETAKARKFQAALDEGDIE
jgi:hypothetical protein